MPQWCKLWFDRYDAILSPYEIDEMYKDDPAEMEMLFSDVGRAFVNALMRAAHAEREDRDRAPEYELETREGKRVQAALYKAIEESFADYERRVQDGKKGGRPSNTETETK